MRTCKITAELVRNGKDGEISVGDNDYHITIEGDEELSEIVASTGAGYRFYVDAKDMLWGYLARRQETDREPVGKATIEFKVE